jgi:hypothetical protein
VRESAMRLPSLGLGLVLVSLGALRPAHAKLEPADWKKVETDYAMLFSPAPGKPGFAGDKAYLVEQLVKDGETRAWTMLGNVLVGECTMWLEAQKKVQAKEDEIFPVLKKPTVKRTVEEEAAMFKAQEELVPLEKAAVLEREILDGVVKAVVAAPAALRTTLYARAKSPTSADWLFRAAVAQVAGGQPAEKDSAAFLTRSLNPSSEKDARVRSAALDGLRAFAEGAEDHVIGRIADPDWSVQFLAIRLARGKKLARAIPALIATLERANPRMQEEIGGALREITGQNFDAFADVWAKWWADNREKFQGTEAVKVGGRPKDPPVDNSIYGVPIKSDRILFVIDISGSMKDPMKAPQAATPTPGQPSTPADEVKPPPSPTDELMSGPKIDVAKHELKKAIEKLPKTAMFSIVAFNHATLVWKDHPVIASAENKEEAYKWVREFKPSGSTFSDGALRVAFRIAGLGAIDKAYPEVSVDTIMFISDGAPTDNAADASKPMDYNIVLEHVREWNSQKKVVINCIAIDMQPGNTFMEKLAKENGGVFVDR